jgi:hypothetical protein
VRFLFFIVEPHHQSLCQGEGGILQLQWFSADRERGYVEAAAWVKGPDLAGTI